MAYSDSEIEGAVEKLLLTQIRRTRDPLGVRRTEITFNDFQEAAASAFLLNGGAVFYVALLGARRLIEKTKSCAAVLDEVADLVAICDKTVLPVKDLTPLANARAALAELAAAMVGRSSAPGNVTQVPAYQRFQSNVGDFLAGPGQNVKDGGVIIPTPQEAKMRLPDLLRELRERYDELRLAAELLSKALTSYTDLSLPVVVASSVISRARALLDAHFQALSGLSPEARLAQLRTVVLDLLASKGIVRQLASFQAPEAERAFSGTAQAYADATHPATSTAIVADLMGPFVLPPGGELVFSVDDNATITTQLESSFVAEILGIAFEPFPVSSTLNFETNVFKPTLDGVSTTVTLTAGSRSAAQVAHEINLLIDTTSIRAIPYFALPKLQTNGDVISNGAGLITVTRSISVVDFTLYVTAGDKLIFLDGPNKYAVWIVDTVLSATLTAHSDGPTVTATNTPGVTLQTGASLKMSMRVVKSTGVADRTRVGISDAVSNTAANMLGFVKGMDIACAPTFASSLARDVTGKTTRVVAEVVFVPESEGVLGRSDPSDPLGFIASTLFARGDVVATVGVSVVVTVITLDIDLADVEVGQLLYFRDGPDVGVPFTVSAKTATTITATGAATADAPDLPFDIGFSYSIPIDKEVEIASGPNAGRYVITSQGAVPFDWRFASMLPQTRGVHGEPVPLVFALGSTTVSFRSARTRAPSALAVAGASAPLLFAAGSAPRVAGATPWVALGTGLEGIVAGDVVDIYETSLGVADASYVVDKREGGLARLVPPVSTDTSWLFSLAAPLPFARVRARGFAAFSVFALRLVDWLSALSDEKSYFIELNRRINPLLLNSNPTAVQVNDALSWLRGSASSTGLGKILTSAGALAVDAPAASTLQVILQEYDAPAVPAIDSLIRALQEQGADRARDLLFSCDFASFFGLSLDGASYAGNMLEAARAIVQEDVPVKSTGIAKLQARILSVSASPDYENTPDDAVEQMGDAEDFGQENG